MDYYCLPEDLQVGDLIVDEYGPTQRVTRVTVREHRVDVEYVVEGNESYSRKDFTIRVQRVRN
jgi:hypothetical protein